MGLLQNLSERVGQYERKRKQWFGGSAVAPRGLYIWGGVGRGKTLLMDLFFKHTPHQAKRRIHFHEFMIETHARIDHWRKASNGARRKNKGFDKSAPDDPIPLVAYEIAQQARLLCFDEFQVTDIADAMLLGRLFEKLFSYGVVVVATSNRFPDDLYKDGLNRQLFLPFIEELKQRLDIYELVSAKDYRLGALSAAPVYYSPLGPAATKAMNAAWSRIASGAREAREQIEVQGRILPVPCAARGAARFGFDDLCAQPLGSQDYLAIATRYGTVFIDNIPIMGPEKRNEAKRFVTLIDALYDRRTKLVCSADAEPDALYVEGTGAFEFERTASRLTEMRSDAYLASPHEAEGPPAD